jgi:adenosylcobinamide-GDP ribazoletransferase
VLSALAFLTVLGGSRAPEPGALRWFPLVGAGIGLVLAGVLAGSLELWDPVVAAALVVAADLVVTGLLHVDGLADSADGLLPHLEHDRRLAVMAAPDVGAFALAVVPAVLLLRWAPVATDRVEPLALVAVWAASRTTMAVVPAIVPYARPGGLATRFLGGASAWTALWLLPAAALLVALHGALGAAALAVGVGAGALVVAGARRRIGGFTGDVLGAAGVLSETAALVVLAAR